MSIGKHLGIKVHRSAKFAKTPFRELNGLSGCSDAIRTATFVSNFIFNLVLKGL